MSDAAPNPKAPPEDAGPPRVSNPGLLGDPVVRVMLFVCLGLLILFFAGVLSVLLTGVAQKNGPRTVEEKDLMVAASTLPAGAKGEAFTSYIEALVDARDFSAARIALTNARASVAATDPAPSLDLAEARLLAAQSKYAEAAAAATKAMKGYTVEKEQRSKAATGGATVKLAGKYYDAALVKAYASQELRKWKDAVAMFDIYLRVNRTAADILVDRGNAKLQLDDKKGAEKDFRSALKYIPYDTEAKAGLKKIGVAQ